jgi:hypothetical protein
MKTSEDPMKQQKVLFGQMMFLEHYIWQLLLVKTVFEMIG